MLTLLLQRKLSLVEGSSSKYELRVGHTKQPEPWGPYEKFRDTAGDFLLGLCEPMVGLLMSPSNGDPAGVFRGRDGFKVRWQPITCWQCLSC